MNERIQELMKQAMEPSGLEGLGGSYMELNPEKFAKLILGELVSKMEVEGGDFYHNESNDYGCVTVKFFTGAGDPWHSMRGEETKAKYVNGVIRGTGRYRLNEKFVEYLLETLK